MQNKKVMILHGWGGSDFPHWQAWLAKELEQQNYEVSFPSLPNRDLPKLNEWVDFAKNEYEEFLPDIVICHSLGNILWFNLIEKINIQNIEKLLLVAPVRKDCDIKELEEFFPYKVPTDLKAQKSQLIVSTNDEYMNLHEANELKKELNINMSILENAGHINASSGFGELYDILDWVKE